MKTLMILVLVLIVVSLAGGLAIAGDKYYVPSWGMPQGEITTYPKSHVARVDYTPGMVHQQDKQAMPWFQSTLNPMNLRRESEKEFLVEVGKILSDMFGGRKYEG